MASKVGVEHATTFRCSDGAVDGRSICGAVVEAEPGEWVWGGKHDYRAVLHLVKGSKRLFIERNFESDEIDGCRR